MCKTLKYEEGKGLRDVLSIVLKGEIFGEEMQRQVGWVIVRDMYM